MRVWLVTFLCFGVDYKVGGVVILGHERHLKIARQHLSYIQENIKRRKAPTKFANKTFHPEEDYPVDINHALVTSIFSALAVEAALNSFITVKISHFTLDCKKVKFLAGWITDERYGVEKKIKLINKLVPNLKLKYRQDGIEELFQYRNKWVHYKGRYTGEKISLIGGRIETPVHFTYPGVKFDEIKKAEEHYKIAVTVIEKLK